MSSYIQWTSMYTNEMDDICLGECKQLRKLAMILHVFDKEVIKTRKYIENELKNFGMQCHEIQAKESVPLFEMFAKPSKEVKPKTSLLTMPPKDSPDIFNSSAAHKSDEEVIISSPENCSPKIKKKRYLHKIKTTHIPNTTPKIQNMNCNDFIEGTPDMLRSIKVPSKTTVKKKLFEKNKNKKSQSMVTLTQMYQSIGHQSTVNAVVLPPEETITSQTQNKQFQGNNTAQNNEGESMIYVDDMVKMVADALGEYDKNQSNETQIHNTYKAACEKRHCKICEHRGSPCPKHREPIVFKEPDQTFSGFWDLNFTVDNNRNNDKMVAVNVNDEAQDGNNSTLLI